MNKFQIRYFDRATAQEFADRFASDNKQEDGESNRQKEKNTEDILRNWESYHDSILEEDRKKENKMIKSHERKIVLEHRPFAKSKATEEVN